MPFGCLGTCRYFRTNGLRWNICIKAKAMWYFTISDIAKKSSNIIAHTAFLCLWSFVPFSLNLAYKLSYIVSKNLLKRLKQNGFLNVLKNLVCARPIQQDSRSHISSLTFSTHYQLKILTSSLRVRSTSENKCKFKHVYRRFWLRWELQIRLRF